jgi:hypothetical protein
MVVFAEIAIGTQGELACVQCSGTTRQAQPRPLEDVDAEMDAVFAQWCAGPGPNVAFIGFEPFRHPQLPPLIAAAASRGAQRIRLRSDGGALAQPGNAAGAYAAGVGHLELVLLGDGETHDRLAARPGLFESARLGAAAFAAAAADRSPVAITGRLPLCKHNIAVAPAAVVGLAAMGAIAVTLECSGLKQSDTNESLVAAALDTATVNRVAAYAEGWSGEVPPAHRQAPWGVQGMRS